MTLAFILPDETTTAARAIFEKVSREGAWVPSLWRLEVANSLSLATRRRRISMIFRNEMLEDLARLDLQVDQPTDQAAWSATLTLADRFGLTVYDAAYLELAVRRNLPLATLDRQLLAAAPAAGVAVLGA